VFQQVQLLRQHMQIFDNARDAWRNSEELCAIIGRDVKECKRKWNTMSKEEEDKSTGYIYIRLRSIYW
jgi:hypothetical protein